MEFIKTIIYGIIEGITEWLPISSTGHLILLNSFMPLKVSASFWDIFLVVVQLGAIIAVIILFWKKIFPFKWEKKLVIDNNIIKLWLKIVVACLPGIIIMVLGLDDHFETLFYNPFSVSLALIIVGIIFIIIESKNKKITIHDIKDLSFKTALIIGIFQIIAAIFPGTSRSGITIIGALLLGVTRTVAAEFTFFLAIPAMIGSSLLKLIKYGFAFSQQEIIILIVGTVTAFIVSLLVIKLLMSYIKKHDFKVFGYYRIILGIIVILCTIFNII